MTALLLATTLLAADVKPPILASIEEFPKLAATARVLDARSKAEYDKGHAPNAAWVDVAAWDKAMKADAFEADAWAARLAAVRLSPDSTAVVYADDVREAARLWWMLKTLGLGDVRLLDGGWTAYSARDRNAYPITDRVTAAGPAKPASWKPSLERLATKADLMNILKDKSATVLDARSDGEFCGTKEMSKRSGHVPGAINLEWKELIDPKTTKFKAVEELRKIAAAKKIDLSRPAVAHCQGGGRSAVVAFGLELMGAKDVKNYYRSWGEWGNSDETPIEK